MDDFETRGAKRKALESILSPPKRIKVLDQDVVNKIAAGEIIVAPVHALKEMIENSVDAGATWIEIVVKDGGMRLLQISDNGQGIHVDDLPILCDRFTTSKLRAFEDLSSIATYGFRGEALASISHIAHLRIITRTAESSCAFQAYFRNGHLETQKPGGNSKPKAIAGRKGTQITIEDLFYNVPQRKKAFRSSSEEYAKILDMVGRYSIHCRGIAMTCRKHGENSTGLSISAAANVTERIGVIYGQNLAKELIEFRAKDRQLAFSVDGLGSSANYHAKRTTVLLFINHRAVESSAFKVAIQRLYSAFLPKGSHPFIYASIEIAPERVDVNIHPTKREVGFLNEEEIIDALCQSLHAKLSKSDLSRSFLTQSLLVPEGSQKSPSQDYSDATPKRRHASRITENSLVRTDPQMRKITSMFELESKGNRNQIEYRLVDKARMQIRLTSIKELRAAVQNQTHHGLLEAFSCQTWIGIVDMCRRVFAVQSGLKLFLVDYGMITNELFYQVGLTDFGNFGSIIFQYPLDICKLVRHAVELEHQSEMSSELEAAPEMVTQQLVRSREMLLEYFNLEVSEDGMLMAIPLLLKGYVPCLGKLPRFLLRLGPCVDWHEEKECFRSFLTELADFYTPEQIFRQNNHEIDQSTIDGVVENRAENLKYSLENVIFPAFRSRLVPTAGLLKGVIEVANLKGLYKIFERC